MCHEVDDVVGIAAQQHGLGDRADVHVAKIGRAQEVGDAVAIRKGERSRANSPELRDRDMRECRARGNGEPFVREGVLPAQEGESAVGADRKNADAAAAVVGRQDMLALLVHDEVTRPGAT